MKIIVKIYLLLIFVSAGIAIETTALDLKNIYACEQTSTGLALYKTSIEKLIRIIEDAGNNTTVSLDGSDLIIRLDIPTTKIVIELSAMDSKKLKSKNIICYEPMKFSINGRSISREEGTLTPISPEILYAFSGLLPNLSQKDIIYKSKKEERTHLGKIYKYTVTIAQEQKIKQMYSSYNVNSLTKLVKEATKAYKKKEYIKAIGLFDKACNNGENKSCSNIAYIYNNTEEVKNLNKAIYYYSKACEKGYGEACYDLGFIYLESSNVKKNEKKALDEFLKGCDKNNAMSCYNAGIFYFQGKIVPKDISKAKKYLQYSCMSSYMLGCKKLREL